MNRDAQVIQKVGGSLGWLALSIALILQWNAGCDAQETEAYPVPPEASKQDGVPEGEIRGPVAFRSVIYPGTVRNFWIYVPAQYDATNPACVLIVQDGLRRAEGWNLPTVMDNLIHAGQMPVTIGIFVEPGVVPAAGAQTQPRFNRSFEYDSLGDRYARFLLEEIIPEAGKQFNLSNDPNDRALAGSSSGGIAAFNAAWERPDAFRRVLSTLGTFVGLRGANQLSALVRKMEPKPLRIFLQDGSADLNIYAGDWWVANQDMLSALTWSGYDVKHVWGEGGHNDKHSAAIMPEALRWLWRDYPEPITAATSDAGQRRVDLLIEDQGWQELSSGHEAIEAVASNAGGELFFSDSQAGRIYRVGDDGKTRIFADQTGRINGLAFSPDGQLLAIKDESQIVRFGADGKPTTLLEGVKASALASLPKGFFFCNASRSEVVFRAYDGSQQKEMQFSKPVRAMTPTADNAFLHLIDTGRFTTHARIEEDGSLAARQQYGYLEMPYTGRDVGAGGAVVDEAGLLYVATTEGIQVLDQLGRVNFIISNPSRQVITGIAFSGGSRDRLVVTTGQAVFGRKLKAKGTLSFGQPIQPPRPRL